MLRAQKEPPPQESLMQIGNRMNMSNFDQTRLHKRRKISSEIRGRA